MVRRLTFRSAKLANWLSHFVTNMKKNTFERGIGLFDKHRVWDYHASENGLNASVEDLHNSFFQVHIRWRKEDCEIYGTDQLLPSPDKLDCFCDCPSDGPYCEHVTASIIYWIMRLDDRNEDVNAESAADQGDSPAYQNLMTRFAGLVRSETPSYQRFDANKLRLLPDVQTTVEQIVKSVMTRDDQ